jgi:hypothetical protein
MCPPCRQQEKQCTNESNREEFSRHQVVEAGVPLRAVPTTDVRIVKRIGIHARTVPATARSLVTLALLSIEDTPLASRDFVPCGFLFVLSILPSYAAGG